MKYTGPKARIVRRFGINIFGSDKYDKILQKRNFPPGAHGKTRFSKPSEFGRQLSEKQKLRFTYGLTEKQCRNYYKKAIRQKGESAKNLMLLCERRLDNAFYRAGFAATRMQARQMVSHGLFLLNKRRVTIPSIQIKGNDLLEIREKNKNSLLFKDLDKRKFRPAEWLKGDFKNLKIEVIRLPDSIDFEKTINPQLIIEYYSK